MPLSPLEFGHFREQVVRAGALMAVVQVRSPAVRLAAIEALKVVKAPARWLAHHVRRECCVAYHDHLVWHANQNQSHEPRFW
jgi:hypothetical protein